MIWQTGWILVHRMFSGQYICISFHSKTRYVGGNKIKNKTRGKCHLTHDNVYQQNEEKQTCNFQLPTSNISTLNICWFEWEDNSFIYSLLNQSNSITSHHNGWLIKIDCYNFIQSNNFWSPSRSKSPIQDYTYLCVYFFLYLSWDVFIPLWSEWWVRITFLLIVKYS